MPSPRALVLALLVAAAPAAAQPAVEFDLPTLGNVPPLSHGSLDAADYDGDGALDLLVTGSDGSRARTRAYRFVEETIEVLPRGVLRVTAVYDEIQPSVDLPQVWAGEAVWADYNGDGAPDVLVAGAAALEAPFAPVTRLFVNRSGALVEVPPATRVLVPVYNAAVAWGDMDGDGDLDLAVAGRTEAGARRTDVYRNDGADAFARLNAGLPGVEGGDLAWGDVDGDGDLDLALVGHADAGFVARVYRNDGGAFADTGTSLPGLIGGTVAWADLEGDGDPDLLLAGGVLAPTIAQGFARVYRNDGGTFTALDLGLRGALGVRAAWADVDADGDPDLAIAGPSTPLAAGVYGLRFYTNTGGALAETGRFGGVASGDALWYDYNADGRVDFLQMGVLGGRPGALLFRNGLATAPGDPGGDDDGSGTPGATGRAASF